MIVQLPNLFNTLSSAFLKIESYTIETCELDILGCSIIYRGRKYKSLDIELFSEAFATIKIGQITTGYVATYRIESD